MEPQEGQTNQTSDNIQEVEINGHKDDTIQLLVNLVNSKPDFQIGITLQMGGFLVSGRIISGDNYFDKLGAIMASGLSDGDNENAKLVHESIKALGKKYKEQRLNESIEYGVTTYIHLENCTLGDVRLRSTFQTLWRGRISEVAGFFIGELNAS
jgi:hypothetical protein